MANTRQPASSDGAPTPTFNLQPHAASKSARFLSTLGRRISKSRSSGSTRAWLSEKDGASKQRSTFGILADKETDEVPGTVLLLSSSSAQNEPLGLNRMESRPDETDAGPVPPTRSVPYSTLKRTPDGQIVLDPQPEESPNDPLNWPAWRRDMALLSLGFYSMLGGGMTPILAAGFNDVAQTYDVSYKDVALTTGLYMMGLGIGSVIFSPTAIIYGKRPVYLSGVVLFILSAVWCAEAPSYAQLVIARIFQGIAVSPVECLPSSTIAEIFFLHERAFRVGVYTLLLLGGKNLIPLVSAAVIESLGWRWVFWIVAMCVGFGGVLVFLFVPETFWDRTPRSRKVRRSIQRLNSHPRVKGQSSKKDMSDPRHRRGSIGAARTDDTVISPPSAIRITRPSGVHFENDPTLPHLHHLNSPYYSDLEHGDDYFSQPVTPAREQSTTIPNHDGTHGTPRSRFDAHGDRTPAAGVPHPQPPQLVTSPLGASRLYTSALREAPPKPWIETLKPYHGRISRAQWWRVAVRPFVLFAYPTILWSAMVYALSVGWLIVLSESVAHLFENRATYNFSSIQTGLVYVSPFVGGVLGTAVAGRLSDVVVRFMARRNGGVYEPEFRLVMAIPITITTTIGLMGFGWSIEERDNFWVPTIFFGIISFGCCMGSTTSITFALDSYRQFAGEALVTLNFSKNVLHGLVWSLFFPSWLQRDGSRTVFLAIGGIQMGCLLTTIPMYIYGKRSRMWTVRRRMMERL